MTTSTAQWAYGDSAMLNDPTSGSTGSCAASIRYICNAGTGYDGPTGAGSISGAVATGAPGIGGPANGSGSSPTYAQTTRSHGATLEAGIYPNGLDTSWWIEYGTDNSYGQQTRPTDIGSGAVPAAVTGYLSHLDPGTTYHYRLVAQNSLGTTYGYDYSFTTPQASPTDPTAAFSAPTAATPGAVAFDATGSDDSGDSIADYSWDFGDGTGLKDRGPSATTTHHYTSPGVYKRHGADRHQQQRAERQHKPASDDRQSDGFVHRATDGCSGRCGELRRLRPRPTRRPRSSTTAGTSATGVARSIPVLRRPSTTPTRPAAPIR